MAENRSVSIEVVSEDAKGMFDEGVAISKLRHNAVVKVPLTIEGLKAVRELSEENISTNVTLVFSANQALLAAKAGAHYVSIFVGRLDDIGINGMHVVEETDKVFGKYEAKIIAASIRHPLHVIDAAKSNADIATLPYSVLEKLPKHPLTDIGLKQFLEDYKQWKK